MSQRSMRLLHALAPAACFQEHACQAGCGEVIRLDYLHGVQPQTHWLILWARLHGWSDKGICPRCTDANVYAQWCFKRAAELQRQAGLPPFSGPAYIQ